MVTPVKLNTPYSYYNTVNPTAPALKPPAAPVKPASAPTAPTTTTTNKTTPDFSKPVLTKELITFLQQLVNDTASGDVGAILGGNSNNVISSVLGSSNKKRTDATSLAGFYDSLVQGAVKGANERAAANAANFNPIDKILKSYQSAINVKPASTTTVTA